jgi:hypothetical protein
MSKEKKPQKEGRGEKPATPKPKDYTEKGARGEKPSTPKPSVQQDKGKSGQ